MQLCFQLSVAAVAPMFCDNFSIEYIIWLFKLFRLSSWISQPHLSMMSLPLSSSTMCIWFTQMWLIVEFVLNCFTKLFKQECFKHFKRYWLWIILSSGLLFFGQGFLLLPQTHVLHIYIHKHIYIYCIHILFWMLQMWWTLRYNNTKKQLTK
jgi:hypothetical protein